MASVFLARPGLGHTPGLSVAEFEVTPSGRVDARFTLASAEPLHGAPLDHEDLRAFVLDGVDVEADGARCEPTFSGASPTEADGLLLEASYACPPGAAVVEATLYYLSALGPGHREIARIVAPGATSEAVLTGSRRALSLSLPGAHPASRGLRARWAPWLWALSGAGAVAGGLALWRRRRRLRAS